MAAGLAEVVDAQVSKTCGITHMSSSLMPSTTLDKYFGEIKISELYIFL